MTSVEFMKRVRDARPDLSQASLEFATVQCRREGKMNEAGVERCVKLATYLDEYWAFRIALQPSDMNASPDADEALARTALLTQDELLEKLEPLVKATRENIFHHSHAPFASKEAAANWIKRQASAPWHASAEEKASLYQLDRHLREKATEWRMRTGLEWREGGPTLFLPYEDGEEGGVKTVRLTAPKPWEEHPAMPSPLLVELERAVEGMADTTGFYKDSLVTYILTGIPPELPPFKTTTSAIFQQFTDISRFQVTLDFLTGDVTDKEQRQVYRQYRKSFSTTKRKSPLRKHEDFLALVKRHGEPPKGRGSGAKAFWEKIRQEWHTLQGCKVWKDAWAAKRYYVRLEKKLLRKKGVNG